MSKIEFDKPGNFLYPLPAVMVSCTDKNGKNNIITIAWTGTVCSDPAMVYISVRPERYSHDIIKDTGEFVINLVNKELVKSMDFCGVKSGRDVDKFKECRLTAVPSETVEAPSIAQSPVCIECKVTKMLRLGSHDMFLAKVTAVTVDEKYMDETGRFHLNESGLVAYSHGDYFSLGAKQGKFGYSVRKHKAAGKSAAKSSEKPAGKSAAKPGSKTTGKQGRKPAGSTK